MDTITYTKTHKQQRRSRGKVSKTYLFDGNRKSAFLSNYENKLRLISMLKSLLLFHGIEVEQATADADYLVTSCLEDSMKHSIWCSAVDTS